MVRFERVLRGRAAAVRDHRADRRQPDRRPAPRRRSPTCAEELRAAAASGHPTEDANRAFIEPAQLSYPLRLRAHRAALRQPVRARPGRQSEVLRLRPATRASTARSTSSSRARRSRSPARASARACTTTRRATSTSRRRSAASCGFPLHRRQATGAAAPPASAASRRTSICSGRTAACSTRSSTRRRAAPSASTWSSSTASATASCSACSSSDDPVVANLRRMLDRSARFRYGSTVNFPTHHLAEPQRASSPAPGAAITTSSTRRTTRARRASAGAAGPGHDDRELPRQPASRRCTKRFTACSAPRRSPRTSTSRRAAAPTTPPLERRVVGPRDRLKALTAELTSSHQPALARRRPRGRAPRSAARRARPGAGDGAVRRSRRTRRRCWSRTSSRSPTAPGTSTARTATACARRSPRPIAGSARCSTCSRRKGLLDSTLFVFTSDHGMAAQDVAPAPPTRRAIRSASA